MNIHLAGAEGTTFRGLIEANLQSNIFISFWKFRSQVSIIPHLLALKAASRRVIIDSGAHGFFSNSEHVPSASRVRIEKKSEIDADKYFDEYLTWLLAHQDLYDYFVELDIGEIVDQAKVYEWRRWIEAAGLLDRMIIVYHPATETERQFFKRAQDMPSRYVGLQGYRKNVPVMDYVRLLKRFYDAGR